jgi:hypothetical protein
VFLLHDRFRLSLRDIVSSLDAFTEGGIIEKVAHLWEGLIVGRACRFGRWGTWDSGPFPNLPIAGKDPFPPNSRDSHRDICDFLDTARLCCRESTPVGHNHSYNFWVISRDKCSPVLENLGRQSERRAPN